MLVKTAYKDFPRELLSQNNLQRSEWNTVTSETDDGELQACHSLDLQLKDFISTYKIQRQVQVIHKKHHGLVPSPQAAETYLKYAASINIHNHV